LDQVSSHTAAAIDNNRVLHFFKKIRGILSYRLSSNRIPALFIINLDPLIIPAEKIVLALDEFLEMTWYGLFLRDFLLLRVVPFGALTLYTPTKLVILIFSEFGIRCLLPYNSHKQRISFLRNLEGK
jgi:hypothetical protein